MARESQRLTGVQAAALSIYGRSQVALCFRQVAVLHLAPRCRGKSVLIYMSLTSLTLGLLGGGCVAMGYPSPLWSYLVLLVACSGPMDFMCAAVTGLYCSVAAIAWPLQDLPIVSEATEDSVRAELYGDAADVEGEWPAEAGSAALSRRVGAALRIAKEVKVLMGGTPEYTTANMLVVAKNIERVCLDNGITRRVDQFYMLNKARPLVFTPLPEEVEAIKWLNSEVCQSLVMEARRPHAAVVEGVVRSRVAGTG